MYTYTEAQHDALAKIADFDHVFMVSRTGDVGEQTTNLHYAPEAVDVDQNATELDGWQLPLSGLTGQYGYHGPWLHDSEVIAGGVAEAVLSMPGYWVAIYGQHSAFDPDDSNYDFAEDGTEIEGWTLAYKPFVEAI